MEENALLEQIAEKEWKMFQAVNGSDRVSCQEDEGTFKAMRRAQFSAWSPEAAESYLRDLEAAEAQGRNLLREKYIRMMASTQPEGYAAFCGELPQLTPEQEALTAELWKRFLVQTERFAVQFVGFALALQNRLLPLRQLQCATAVALALRCEFVRGRTALELHLEVEIADLLAQLVIFLAELAHGAALCSHVSGF